VKTIKTTSRFLRDLKLARRRGKELAKMEAVIDALARGERLRRGTVRIVFKARCRDCGSATSSRTGS